MLEQPHETTVFHLLLLKTAWYPGRLPGWNLRTLQNMYKYFINLINDQTGLKLHRWSLGSSTRLNHIIMILFTHVTPHLILLLRCLQFWEDLFSYEIKTRAKQVTLLLLGGKTAALSGCIVKRELERCFSF